jgi:Rod binding domain-containing protein
MPIAPAASLLPSSPPIRERADNAREAKEARLGTRPGDAFLAAQTPSNRTPHVDRSKVDPKIVEAAEGMETMFVDYLMKVMRQTVPKNDMDLNNAASEMYQGMLDSENSQNAVRAGGVGLTDTIIAYLAPQSYTLDQRQMNASENAPTKPSPTKRVEEDSRRTGGTK